LDSSYARSSPRSAQSSGRSRPQEKTDQAARSTAPPIPAKQASIGVIVSSPRKARFPLKNEWDPHRLVRGCGPSTGPREREDHAAAGK
jgi:hypothetical protein